jgi:hypothetical protein
VKHHAVRTPVAWVLYGVGHFASRINNLVPERAQSERLADVMYACYSRPMQWSVKVQGPYSGPWEPEVEK